MKMYRHKLICILTVMAIAASGLTLCGCSESSNVGDDENPVESVQQQESRENPVDWIGDRVNPSESGGIAGGRLFEGVVEAGIIVQQQADLMLDLMEGFGDMYGEGMLSMIGQAVEAGIITEEEADELEEFINENSGFPAGFDGNRPDSPDMQGMGIFGRAVEDGIITEEEAEGLTDLMMQNGATVGRDMDSVLDEAVLKGLITREQADDLTEFMGSPTEFMKQGRPEFGNR